MFKYKSTPIILLIFLVIFSIYIAFVINLGKTEVKNNSELMKNNIQFTGIITNIKISGNHAFGILQLKIVETNNHSFSSLLNDKLYPYAIKGDVAEIYHFIPLELKEGYKVVFNSNSETLKVYNHDKFLYEWEVSIVTEKTDINFVKENTSLK